MSETLRRVLIATISDSVSAGTREDRSGTLAAAAMEAHGWSVSRAIVPDERDQISALLQETAGTVELILTTGGTGLTPRDVTPDVTAPLLERLIPGIPEAIRMLGRSQTPAAILSRGVAGVLRGTLIVNLPGGSGAVRDGLAILLPVLEHARETIAGPVDHG
jgi:molybdenum cofactor synthesis domain-containing protein